MLMLVQCLSHTPTLSLSLSLHHVRMDPGKENYLTFNSICLIYINTKYQFTLLNHFDHHYSHIFGLLSPFSQFRALYLNVSRSPRSPRSLGCSLLPFVGPMLVRCLQFLLYARLDTIITFPKLLRC